MFVLLLRAENLPDLRKEGGAWCTVWLFSGGTVRRRFCRGQPVLLSSVPHTRPHPWGSSSCWAPAGPPTTRQDWGKSEKTKGRTERWIALLCASLCLSMIFVMVSKEMIICDVVISETACVMFDFVNFCPLSLSSLLVCPAVCSCLQGQSRVTMWLCWTAARRSTRPAVPRYNTRTCMNRVNVIAFVKQPFKYLLLKLLNKHALCLFHSILSLSSSLSSLLSPPHPVYSRSQPQGSQRSPESPTGGPGASEPELLVRHAPGERKED